MLLHLLFQPPAQISPTETFSAPASKQLSVGKEKSPNSVDWHCDKFMFSNICWGFSGTGCRFIASQSGQFQSSLIAVPAINMLDAPSS